MLLQTGHWWELFAECRLYTQPHSLQTTMSDRSISKVIISQEMFDFCRPFRTPRTVKALPTLHCQWKNPRRTLGSFALTNIRGDICSPTCLAVTPYDDIRSKPDTTIFCHESETTTVTNCLLPQFNASTLASESGVSLSVLNFNLCARTRIAEQNLINWLTSQFLVRVRTIRPTHEIADTSNVAT
jgi:hypothetical protein